VTLHHLLAAYLVLNGPLTHTIRSAQNVRPLDAWHWKS